MKTYKSTRKILNKVWTIEIPNLKMDIVLFAKSISSSSSSSSSSNIVLHGRRLFVFGGTGTSMKFARTVKVPVP